MAVGSLIFSILGEAWILGVSIALGQLCFIFNKWEKCLMSIVIFTVFNLFIYGMVSGAIPSFLSIKLW